MGELFQELMEVARRAAVGFSIVYNESDDSWYCTVESPAKSERFIGKNTTLIFALKDAIRHINGLGSSHPHTQDQNPDRLPKTES